MNELFPLPFSTLGTKLSSEKILVSASRVPKFHSKTKTNHATSDRHGVYAPHRSYEIAKQIFWLPYMYNVTVWMSVAIKLAMTKVEGRNSVSPFVK